MSEEGVSQAGGSQKDYGSQDSQLPVSHATPDASAPHLASESSATYMEQVFAILLKLVIGGLLGYKTGNACDSCVPTLAVNHMKLPSPAPHK